MSLAHHRPFSKTDKKRKARAGGHAHTLYFQSVSSVSTVIVFIMTYVHIFPVFTYSTEIGSAQLVVGCVILIGFSAIHDTFNV